MEALQRTNLDEMIRLGDIFQKSGFFKDIREASQAVTKILYGAELGFSPVVSIMGIYIVDGKPAISANLLGAMVKRSGKYDYRVQMSTNDRCAIEFYQAGQQIGVSAFTMEDAKNASLTGKDNWRKYPKAMLFARALSQGVRTYCPDTSACPLYVPEELGAEVNEEGAVVRLPSPVTAETVIIERPPVKVPEAVTVGSGVEVKTVKVEAIEDDPFTEKFLSNDQCGKLARRFRESLREDLKPMAEELRHDALRAFGYVDSAGNPSSSIILAKDFVSVGKKMIDFAKGL